MTSVYSANTVKFLTTSSVEYLPNKLSETLLLIFFLIWGFWTFLSCPCPLSIFASKMKSISRFLDAQYVRDVTSVYLRPMQDEAESLSTLGITRHGQC